MKVYMSPKEAAALSRYYADQFEIEYNRKPVDMDELMVYVNEQYLPLIQKAIKESV